MSETSLDLIEMADDLLREDGRRECCRECGGYGTETRSLVSVLQDHYDHDGYRLVIDFPALECVAGHRWFPGDGRRRGITSGANPILLDEHLRERRSREIYCAVGTPDPSIRQGVYGRAHPQGRKLATTDQRRRNAGFFA